MLYPVLQASIARCGATFTSNVKRLPSAMTLMLAVPYLCAVITPDLLTVATEDFLDLYVILLCDDTPDSLILDVPFGARATKEVFSLGLVTTTV